MSISVYWKGIALAIGVSCIGLAPAQHALGFYEFDPVLSLTGACGTAAPDPVADPGCPYPPPPEGPIGRFDEPRSVAIDSYGNEYVASHAGDGENGRIDVFDDEGTFITELADPHGPKSVAVDSKGNLYVFEQGLEGGSEVVRYSPTIYKPEAGEIEYGNARVRVFVDKNAFLGGVAIDASNDHLFVSTGGGFEVKEYNSAEEGSKPLNTITHPKLKVTNWVAVDSGRRRLFASYCKDPLLLEECGVLVFEAAAPYALLAEIDGSNVPNGEFRSKKGWTSIAVDEKTGHFFIEDLEQTKNVYEFTEDYEYVSTTAFGDFQGGNALQIAVSNSPLNPGATNRGHLFVPVAIAAGRALAFKPPKERAPKVLAASVANISEGEAELRATIHPEGGQTTYVFEYVSREEFEEDGFANASLGGEGEISAPSGPTQVFGVVEGLFPGGAYRFRVVAENPVGVDESGGAFATYSDAPSPLSCSNQILRTGLSEFLPDCRAYELVTPPDTNGKPPRGSGVEGDRFGMVSASPLGSAISFELKGGSLPGTEGTGGYHGDTYHVERSASGWISTPMGPSGTESSEPLPGSVSPDQGYSFWVASGAGTAVVDGGEGRYVRYPDGHSELIGRGSLGEDPKAKGRLITQDGTHIVFQTDNFGGAVAQQLEVNAPPAGTEAVYDRTRDSATGKETTHVVSLLPGNITPAAGKDAAYLNASSDGDGIAFEIEGTLYLRLDNAVTYEIGDGLAFAGLSEGGQRIFYVKGGELHAFDTTTKAVIPFTSVGDAVPVNLAPDGTRAYFVTTEVISGGGQNPNGAFAKAGQQNLYLSEEGDVTFIATVTSRDVEGELGLGGAMQDGLGLWNEALVKRQPGLVPARLTPDGSVLVFHSRANLDGYDSGGVPQVYRYDDVADRLHCISCVPTGIPAKDGASLQSFSPDIPTAPHGRYGFVTNLRSDGKRLFFESTEALVSTDTDEAQDVYEWEEEGVGSCERLGGCIYLVSSGHSVRDDFLFGVSSSGDDVFFTTDDVLTAGDGGTLSIYDAKVNGGFAETPLNPCQEVDFCRGQANPPPTLPSPPSEALPPPPRKKFSPRCPKGKRKIRRNGKARCVKKHRKHHQRKAGSRQGAAR